MHFLLHSIAGFPSSPSFSPNFPNCSSPRESASVYAAYLRSHFSVSQSKALRKRARGYLSELRQATCPEESHSFFCSPFSPSEFLVVERSSGIGEDERQPMMARLATRWRRFNLVKLVALRKGNHPVKCK